MTVLKKGMSIGNIQLDNGIFLAPMAGYTDSPFRRLCAGMGAEWTVSEMISAKAVYYGDKKTVTLAQISGGEGYTAIQIFGREADIMAYSAGKLLSLSKDILPAAIDINMGCPVKKITSNGEGSALMKEPLLCGRIVEAVKREAEKTSTPVTVKIRAGWDEKNINAPEVARILAESGADCIFVHGRTKEQMYSGHSSNKVIRSVREAVPRQIPVVGNGDITSCEEARIMKEESGCDGVMIGREALGNPWIFEFLSGRRNVNTADENERCITALSLIREIIELYGEETGVKLARGRAAYFIKGMRDAARLRMLINSSHSFKEIEAILMCNRTE